MRRKKIPKRMQIALGVSGLVLIAALFTYAVPKTAFWNSSTVLGIRDTVAFLDQGNTVVGVPVRLRIPRIRVDAAVEYVGLTPDGAMDVPKGPNEVAWFRLGARPGEEGTAVIAGHYGWKNDIPAVFDNLYKLDIGDRIVVEDEHGIATTFIVRKTRTYDKDEDVPAVFTSSDGIAHLNLITCSGTWSEADKTRSERLVVFTDRE